MSATAPRPTVSTSAPALPRAGHGTRRPLVAAAAAAAIAAGGYAVVHLAQGDGSSEPTPAAQLLDNQVLATTSLPGLTASRPPVVVRSAEAWAGTQTPAVVAQPAGRLRALGFTGAVVGRLHSTGAQWTSVAERYRTPAGARAEAGYLYAQLRSARGATVSGFAVAGVPGAHGVSVAGPRATQVVTVFAADRFAYVVSARVSASASQAGTQARVSMAGGWLYLALNGCVARVDHRGGTPPIPVSGQSTTM